MTTPTLDLPPLEVVETDTAVKEVVSTEPEALGSLRLTLDQTPRLSVGGRVPCRYSLTADHTFASLRVPPHHGPRTVLTIPPHPAADELHAVALWSDADEFVGYITADRPFSGAGRAITLVWHFQDPDLWWVTRDGGL